jgi:DNA invertase Pin-like site-specific DNA recombinase
VNTAKTAIYVRVSTNNGSQSTDSQLFELNNYCAMRGWTDVEIYEDHVSGSKASRPALDKMVKQMRAGKILRVVCLKIDRLGRSISHLAMLIAEMSKLNIPLLATTQGIDTSSDSAIGSLQLNIIMAFANFERELIRERVNCGLRAARNRGVRLGRPSMLHKRRDEVMKLKFKGAGIRAIGRELNMAPASVYKILKTEENK